MGAFLKLMKRTFMRIGDFFRRLFGLKRWGQIYYINGAQVLPAPLSHEEESRIIDALEGDTGMRAVLVEHNLRLVVYIARKFENTGIMIEDLISIGTVGLMKAINTFRADRNIKLATYASRCIENEILMYIRKNHSRRREVSIDEPLRVDGDGNELLLSDVLGSDADAVSHDIERQEERQMVRDSVSTLSPREREIIELRFGLRGGRERTQKEVADTLGISQSYISRLEKKIILQLREQMASKL